MTLQPEELCLHQSGAFTIFGDDGLRCEQCHARLLLISEPAMNRLSATLAGHETVRVRIEALVTAEEITLRSPMSRQERACRKATRDAYRLVLDLMDEAHEEDESPGQESGSGASR